MKPLDLFMKMTKGKEVFCCQKINEDGNLVGISGTVITSDENYIIIRGKDSVHLISLKDIIEIEHIPSLEIAFIEGT
jgi:RNase P/RNase MRP subunit p29